MMKVIILSGPEILSARNESKNRKSMLGLIKSLFDEAMANKLYTNI